MCYNDSTLTHKAIMTHDERIELKRINSLVRSITGFSRYDDALVSEVRIAMNEMILNAEPTKKEPIQGELDFLA